MDIQNFRILFVLVWALAASCQVFEVHPKNATVLEGDNHHLQCLFNETIKKCTWLWEKGDPIAITERYEYLASTSKGENTKNCSIVIIGFSIHDVHYWQCSYRVSDSESPLENAKSEKAHLTMAKSKPPIAKNSSIEDSENDQLEDFILSLGLSKLSAIIVFAVGIFILVLIIAVSIGCYLRKPGKKAYPGPKSNCSDLPEVTYTNLNGSLSALSYNHLLKTSVSTLSVCTNCQQLVAESSTPRSLRSTPGCKQRHNKLPDRLHNDVTGSSALVKQLRMGSASSMPWIPQTPDSYQTASDFSEMSPMDKDVLTISPSSPASTTTNPLYESASGVQCNKETRVFFPTSPSATSGVVQAKYLPESVSKPDIQHLTAEALQHVDAPGPTTENMKKSSESDKNIKQKQAGNLSPKTNKNEKQDKGKKPVVPDHKDFAKADASEPTTENMKKSAELGNNIKQKQAGNFSPKINKNEKQDKGKKPEAPDRKEFARTDAPELATENMKKFSISDRNAKQQQVENFSTKTNKNENLDKGKKPEVSDRKDFAKADVQEPATENMKKCSESDTNAKQKQADNFSPKTNKNEKQDKGKKPKVPDHKDFPNADASEPTTENMKKSSESDKNVKQKHVGNFSPKTNKNEKLDKRKPEVPDCKDLYENLKYRGSHIL